MELSKDVIPTGKIWKRRLFVLVRTENILRKKLFKNNGVTIIIASGANFETSKSSRTGTVNRDQQETLKNPHTLLLRNRVVSAITRIVVLY